MFLKFGDKTKKVSIDVSEQEDGEEKIVIDGEAVEDKGILKENIKRAVNFFTQKNKTANNKK